MQEGDGGFDLILVLSNVTTASSTVTVSYIASSTATNGVDVTVPTGQTAFNISQAPAGDYTVNLGRVSILDDSLTELTEQIGITITATGQTFANGTNTFNVLVPLLDNEPIVGTNNADTINGAQGRDIIQGLGGDDLLIGRGGADMLFGADGNDVLYGA